MSDELNEFSEAELESNRTRIKSFLEHQKAEKKLEKKEEARERKEVDKRFAQEKLKTKNSKDDK